MQSYMWPFLLALLIQYIFEIHPYCRVYSTSFHLKMNNIPLYGYTTSLMNLSVNRHFPCCNKWESIYLFKSVFSFSLDKYSEVELSEYTVVLFLIF